MTRRPPPSGASRRTVRFRGGVRTLLGFGAAFALLAVASLLVGDAVAGIALPGWVGLAAGLGKFGLLAGVTWLVLRAEGVGAAELGLSPTLVPPALLAFAGVYLAVNLLGVAVATVTGEPWGLDLLSVPLRWEDVPAPVATSLSYALVVGLVEEFVFRGYLQTKVVALLGDDTRPRVAVGILAASVAFGVLHAPAAVVAGASLPSVVALVAFRTLSGIGFGLLYELSHNVYFVALLHALGNTWPLVVDVWNWSGGAFAAAALGAVVIYVGAALGYRHLLAGTDLRPVVRREDVRATPS